MTEKSIVLSANSSWYLANFRLSTLKMLRQEGFHVFCLAPRDRYSSFLVKNGGEFVSIDIDPYDTSPMSLLRLIKVFVKKYKEINPVACMHFTAKPNMCGTAACDLIGVPSINNISGLGMLFSPKAGIRGALGRMAYAFSQRRASWVFFQKKQDRDVLESGFGIGHGRIGIIPGSGVNLGEYRPTQLAGTETFRFLYLGRLLREKGVMEAIEAVKGLRKMYGERVTLEVVGMPVPKAPNLVNLEHLHKLDKEGCISLSLDIADVRHSISKAHCVVLPTYYNEGVPKSLLEAGAMGRPVITTDLPGCRDAVSPTLHRFLCKKQDTADLMRRMEMMLSLDMHDLWRLGMENRVHVERHFNENIVLDAYLKVIARIINRRVMRCAEGNKWNQ